MDYPYKIKKEKGVLEEIKFYQINAGEKIAELKAGRGAIGILLSAIYEAIDIHITTKTTLVQKELMSLFDNIDNKKKETKLKVITVNGFKTKLETQNLDKIILREGFHHIKKKEKLLASIKDSLKKEGKLYIRDILLELGADWNCEKALEKEEMIKLLAKNGFEFLEEIRIGRRILMEFKKME